MGEKILFGGQNEIFVALFGHIQGFICFIWAENRFGHLSVRLLIPFGESLLFS